MGKKRRDIEILNKIALRIKELRAEMGITQEVFYNDTGIHIARIEKSELDISISTIAAICEYLNISISEFFQPIS